MSVTTLVSFHSVFFLGIWPRVHNDKVWPLNFAMLF